MARIEFNWSHNGKREDGSDVSALHYRLYENGEIAVDDIGELQFSLLMDGKDFGEYRYHVTAVDSFNLESQPSNVAVASFFPPTAPIGFSASFAG